MSCNETKSKNITGIRRWRCMENMMSPTRRRAAEQEPSSGRGATARCVWIGTASTPSPFAPLTMRSCRSEAFSMDMACAGRERPAGGSNRQKGSSSAADIADGRSSCAGRLPRPAFLRLLPRKQLYFCAPYATVVGEELCWGALLPGLVWEI